jgi:hypothetical protein
VRRTFCDPSAAHLHPIGSPGRPEIAPAGGARPQRRTHFRYPRSVGTGTAPAADNHEPVDIFEQCIGTPLRELTTPCQGVRVQLFRFPWCSLVIRPVRKNAPSSRPLAASRAPFVRYPSSLSAIANPIASGDSGPRANTAMTSAPIQARSSLNL